MFLIQPSGMGLLKQKFAEANDVDPALHQICSAINKYVCVNVCSAHYVSCDSRGWAPKDAKLKISIKSSTPSGTRWAQQVFYTFATDVERRTRVYPGLILDYVTTAFDIDRDELGEWAMTFSIEIFNNEQQHAAIETLLKAIKSNRMRQNGGQSADVCGSADTPYPDDAMYPLEHLKASMGPGFRPMIPEWHLVDGVIKTTYWDTVRYYKHILIKAEELSTGCTFEEAQERVLDYMGFRQYRVEKILTYLMDAYPPFIEGDHGQLPEHRPWTFVKNRTSEWPRRPRGV